MTREAIVDKYAMELYLTTSHKKTKRLLLKLLDDLDNVIKHDLPPAEGAEQAGSEREYPYCPTCGDTIDHGEDYGGYCCTKCRDGHNNDLTARPLNREMKRPNLELEYRFSRNRGCYIHPLTGRSYEDDLEAYINYLTALIRDELIAYDKWCATNYKQPCVNTADRNVDEYLKSRDK